VGGFGIECESVNDSYHVESEVVMCLHGYGYVGVHHEDSEAFREITAARWRKEMTSATTATGKMAMFTENPQLGS
jgi:cupin superfamily acireductone dioxygenase involved in methionine salvage